ncbi:MAG TPA: DUF4328 domain-containing protein, partial [Gemmatimonadaceae bacterium]
MKPLSTRPWAWAVGVVLGAYAAFNVFLAGGVAWIVFIGMQPQPARALRLLGLLYGQGSAESAGVAALWRWLDSSFLLRAPFAALATTLFIVWLYRAHRNLDAFSATSRYRSRQAVTSWFIPFVNLIRPYRVVREVWRGSASSPGDTVRATHSPPWLRLWWTLFLTVIVLNNIAQWLLSRDRVEESGVVTTAFLLGAAVSALWIAVIWRIERAQGLKLRATSEPIVLAERPGRWWVPDAVVFATLFMGLAGLSSTMYSAVTRSFEAMAAEQVAHRAAEAKADSALQNRAAAPDAAVTSPTEADFSGRGVEGGVVGEVVGGVVGGVAGGVPGRVPGAAPREIGIPSGVPGGVPGGVPAPLPPPPSSPPSAPPRVRVGEMQGKLIS